MKVFIFVHGTCIIYMNIGAGTLARLNLMDTGGIGSMIYWKGGETRTTPMKTQSLVLCIRTRREVEAYMKSCLISSFHKGLRLQGIPDSLLSFRKMIVQQGPDFHLQPHCHIQPVVYRLYRELKSFMNAIETSAGFGMMVLLSRLPWSPRMMFKMEILSRLQCLPLQPVVRQWQRNLAQLMECMIVLRMKSRVIMIIPTSLRRLQVRVAAQRKLLDKESTFFGLAILKPSDAFAGISRNMSLWMLHAW